MSDKKDVFQNGVCIREDFCESAQEIGAMKDIVENREDFDEKLNTESKKDRYKDLELTTGEGREAEIPPERGTIPRPNQDEIDKNFEHSVDELMDEVPVDRTQEADVQEYEVEKE